MEVVVLLVAIVGVALLVIPRIQRQKASAGRSPKARKPARRRKVAAAPLVAAPAVASWSPPPAASDSGPDADVWEDDLGWEGGEAAAPSPAALEAWEQWRTTDSPLAAAAAAADAAAAASEPETAPEPAASELPSVERWRAQADEQEWVEDDDDGLGWEGEEEPPGPQALWNGDRHSPAPASDTWAPAGTLSPTPDAWNSGRDWSRRDESRAPEQEAAPAFATASMTDVAPASEPAPVPVEEPELGRTIALEEDDEWDAPVGRSWGAPAPVSPPVEAAPPRSSRRSRLHPVLLVAVYAAIGIGAVVLASTFLLGGSKPSRSAVTATATPTPSVKRAAATATPSVQRAAVTPTPVATPDPAVAAAARNDFTRERASAVRSHDAAVKAAIADRKRAVKKAKARAAREAAARKKDKAARVAATPTPSSSSTYTPPAQTYTPPATTNKAPATKRRSVCEFCIG